MCSVIALQAGFNSKSNCNMRLSASRVSNHNNVLYSIYLSCESYPLRMLIALPLETLHTSTRWAVIGNMCLFKRQEKDWLFVAVLESFPHQSLINRRLNHVYLERDNIAFVYNNRVREYDLGTGKMIVNQQVRNARNKEYLGKDITKKFIGKVVHRD